MPSWLNLHILTDFAASAKSWLNSYDDVTFFFSPVLLFLPEHSIIKTASVPGGVRSNVLPVSRFTFMYIPEEHSAAGACFTRLNCIRSFQTVRGFLAKNILPQKRQK